MPRIIRQLIAGLVIGLIASIGFYGIIWILKHIPSLNLLQHVGDREIVFILIFGVFLPMTIYIALKR